MSDTDTQTPQEENRLDLAEVAARLAVRGRPASGDPAIASEPSAAEAGAGAAGDEDAPEQGRPDDAPAEGSADGEGGEPAGDEAVAEDRDEADAVRSALEGESAPSGEDAAPELSVAERQLSGAEAYAAVEALLFAADRPVTPAQIARALPHGINAREVRRLLKAIGEELASGERGFELRELGGGWQLLTRGKFAPYVLRLKRVAAARKLSGSALETLAVVAYKQPVNRAEIERIRGVACGDMLRSLMEKRLVRLAGRSTELGSPLLYGTTPEFLEHFGLAALSDLPRSGELTRKPAADAPAAPGPVAVVGEDSAAGTGGGALETAPAEAAAAGADQAAADSGPESGREGGAGQ